MEKQKKQKEKNKGGGVRETLIAFVICSLVLLLPMFEIEHEYKLFTEQYGEAREGAAGATLALAVVFRTVSRTVLRTIIRTSARAGMRASLRGAIRTSIRTVGRAQSKGLLRASKENQKEHSTLDNYKSLLFASVLLYLSWVIVIGLGQPFSELKFEESSEIALQQEEEEQKKRLEGVRENAYAAYEAEQAWKASRKELSQLKEKLKKERDSTKYDGLNAEINRTMQEIIINKEDYESAMEKSKNQKLNPKEAEIIPEAEQGADDYSSWLYTLAPYPSEPTPGTRFKISIQEIKDGRGNKVGPFNFEYVVGERRVQKDIKSKEYDASSTGAFSLLKVYPAPGEVNWVQLSKGIRMDFSDKVASFGTITDDHDQIAVGQSKQNMNSLNIKIQGRTPWSSAVIWFGGIAIFIPLWVIYFVQAFVARREKLSLVHETGPVGGGIQLYFAGAFSFMPLTSDVIVPSANTKQRAYIALAGLLFPSALAFAFWCVWKQVHDPRLLFLADAFLIFPMVQCFPLKPLEGIYVWRWNKLVYGLVFTVVMGMFMLVASEGLKNVI